MVDIKIHLDQLNHNQYDSLVKYLVAQNTVETEDHDHGWSERNVPKMIIESVSEVKGNPPIYKGVNITFSTKSEGIRESFEGLIKLLTKF